MIVAFLIALAPHAHAARFANQFVEFEIPAQWGCNLEGAEWVCQSSNVTKKRDAIIILAAKLRGDQDSLDQYLSYVKNPKSYSSVQGTQVKSEPKYAKTVDIQGHTWVDALHLDSEIPGFYTRYLATVKNDIGVLVTYSINKQKYQQYLADFEGMIKTLRVFRKSGGLNAAPAGQNLFQTAQIPKELTASSVFPEVKEEQRTQRSAGSGQDDLVLYGLIAAGVAIFLLILRKRRRR